MRRTELLEEQEIDRLQPAFRMGMYREQIDRWDPSRVSEKKERIRLVREAVDRLPEGYRQVIILRDMSEFSTAEAAEILDISEGALRVRLHRARQAVRALLDPHFKEP